MLQLFKNIPGCGAAPHVSQHVSQHISQHVSPGAFAPLTIPQNYP